MFVQSEPDGFASFHLYVCAAFLTRFSRDLQRERDFHVSCNCTYFAASCMFVERPCCLVEHTTMQARYVVYLVCGFEFHSWSSDVGR